MAICCAPCFSMEVYMEETGYETFAFYYDSLTQNVNYDERAEYFDRLIQTFLHSSGNVLLDLACGTGTMSEKMTKRGYDVIGVDYSDSMLNQALEKKLEKGLSIQYVMQDMRELELYGTVDATICTLDSLNHLPSLADVTRVFQRVFDATEPGGVFLFDMNTLYKHRKILGNEIYLYETEDVYCVWENELQDDQCTVLITLQIFSQLENGLYRRKTEYITERAYASEQIQEALKKVGFHVLGIYHADTLEPLKEDSQQERKHNYGYFKTCHCERCLCCRMCN